MSRVQATLVAKRGGAELSAAQIEDFVAGVCDGRVGDGQLGAFLMAVCCQGMTAAEAGALTRAMRDSGRVFDLAAIPGPKIDKHSTGGVGDKVSLLLAPLMAAAGLRVPMISGRGLGHTGGTLDKLGAIPGYQTQLDPARFMAILADCGYVMGGATADVAPADQRMYAMRDVTGTVASIPLITASILSKKLAAGIEGLVMDVKVGRAAFLPDPAEARALAVSLCATGAAAGLPLRCVLTDMDAPLGRCIGNALEVAEICAALRGEGPADLWQVTAALGAEMLMMGGICGDAAAAQARMQELLQDGSVAACFDRNLAAQGARCGLAELEERLPQAPVVEELRAPAAGYIQDLDPLLLGQVVVELGGGRRQPDDCIDPAVGLRLRKVRGEAVAAGEIWAEVHAAGSEGLAELLARLQDGLVLAGEPPEVADRILAILPGGER